MVRHISFRGLSVLYLLFLKVNRQSEVRDSVIRKRRSTSQVRKVLHVRWAHNPFVEHRHIHEKFVESHILLCECTDEIVKLETGDRKHGLAVEFCVIKPVKKMNPAWPGSSQTNAQLSCELGIATGHESRGFLMAHLDESNFLCPGAKSFHNAVDSVAGKSE